MNPLTIIDKEIHNLVISEDTGAVLLFTPDMKKTAHHYHIELDVDRVRKLHKWLAGFLKRHENEEKR